MSYRDSVLKDLEAEKATPIETPRPKAKGQYRQRKSKPEPQGGDAEQLHKTVVTLVTSGFMFASMLNPKARDYAPTAEEQDAIFLPYERLYLRHLPVPSVNEDATDVILGTQALVLYLIRILSQSGKLHSVFRPRAFQPREEQPQPARSQPRSSQPTPIVTPTNTQNLTPEDAAVNARMMAEHEELLRNAAANGAS